MAMIRTMKGEKSYFQIKAMSINPSCKIKYTLGCRHSELSNLVQENMSGTYHYTDGDGNSINLLIHKMKQGKESERRSYVCYNKKRENRCLEKN
jgi:hypothetical protein